MSNITVYSTVTRGHGDKHGDKRADAAHKRAVLTMVRAANRKPCNFGCGDNALCTHGLDDHGLGRG